MNNYAIKNSNVKYYIIKYRTFIYKRYIDINFVIMKLYQVFLRSHENGV